MSIKKKTISFRCDQQLFEHIEAASRREGLSCEEYVAQLIHDHFNPAAKRRREYHAPRRFFSLEIDPD